MDIVDRVGGDGRTFGVEVTGIDLTMAGPSDISAIRDAVYRKKVVVFPGQHLSPSELVRLGRYLGEVVRYYEPIYAHPDEPDVFVSSNVPVDGEAVGVPKTGQFWHSDYQFTDEPFAFTVFAPQVLPSGNRGTFFVDVGEAYRRLPADLAEAVRGRTATHSVRNYFKIRPQDVYRPISDVLREVDARTPPVHVPLVQRHPVTGEELLYLSDGFTVGLDRGAPDGLLKRLFEASGQSDPTFEHPLIHRLDYQVGDIAVWDNRSLVHRGLHTTTDEAAVSYRVTVRDGLGAAAAEAS